MRHMWSYSKTSMLFVPAMWLQDRLLGVRTTRDLYETFIKLVPPRPIMTSVRQAYGNSPLLIRLSSQRSNANTPASYKEAKELLAWGEVSWNMNKSFVTEDFEWAYVSKAEIWGDSLRGNLNTLTHCILFGLFVCFYSHRHNEGVA